MRSRSLGRGPRRRSNATSFESLELRISLAAPSVAIVAPLDLVVRKNTTHFAFGHAFSFVDAASPGREVLTLAVGAGTLYAPPRRGVRATGERTGRLTISGAVARVDAELARVIYRPSRHFVGLDLLRIAVASTSPHRSPHGPPVTSPAATAAVVVPIIVWSPKPGLTNASAPAITYPSNVNTSEGAAHHFAQASEIGVSDNGAGPSTETWAGAVRNGTLSVDAAVPGARVTGNGTGVLTVSGPLSAVNAALAGLSYAPASGFVGVDILRMQAVDSAGASSNVATLSLTVVPDEPVSVSGASWDGSRLILPVNQNADLPQTTNGSMIFAYENISTQNNAGTISVTTGGSAPTFLNAPALTNQVSFVMNNWDANNLSVTNVSANNDTPIAIQAIGPGIPGTVPQPLCVGVPVTLGPGQTTQGAAPAQYLQLVLSAQPTTDILALIGGPPDANGNNGYVFAVNYSFDSGPGTGVAPPAGFYATTTDNSYTFSFNWGGGTVFVANLSSQNAQDPTVVLRAL